MTNAALNLVSDLSLTPEEAYPMRTKAIIAPFEVAPASSQEILEMRALQQVFDKRFPPIRTDRRDVLIVSWQEIERQFLDLSAPWDQQRPCYEIQRAAKMSQYESAEKTMRWLLSLAHGMTSIDTPEPKWGTGESLPMP